MDLSKIHPFVCENSTRLSLQSRVFYCKREEEEEYICIIIIAWTNLVSDIFKLDDV